MVHYIIGMQYKLANYVRQAGMFLLMKNGLLSQIFSAVKALPVEY